MDGWILFRPEALSLKGLGTLTTIHTIRPLLLRSRTSPLSCPLRKASQYLLLKECYSSNLHRNMLLLSALRKAHFVKLGISSMHIHCACQLPQR
jgi:hypothetical protein